MKTRTLREPSRTITFRNTQNNETLTLGWSGLRYLAHKPISNPQSGVALDSIVLFFYHAKVSLLGEGLADLLDGLASQRIDWVETDSETDSMAFILAKEKEDDK